MVIDLLLSAPISILKRETTAKPHVPPFSPATLQYEAPFSAGTGMSTRLDQPLKSMNVMFSVIL